MKVHNSLTIAIKDYFKGLIEQGKQEVDILEANAEICKIIDGMEDKVLILPCNIGDKVYRFCGPKGKKYVDWRIVSNMTYRLDYKGDIVWEIFTNATDVLGKTVFLTKEEAEKALEEMEK